jgi:GNAT superfamily N-acetyltransferase
MSIVIRESRPDEASELRVIELTAGERFREVGLPEVADHDPPSVDAFTSYAIAGRSWVALDAGHPTGFVLVDEIDGNAHIEQVSVRPDHQGRGVGRALVNRVHSWAQETGRPAVTLVTFKDVPWNAPLYLHLGFHILSENEIGPELRTVREQEANRGLDPATRVCMRLDLPVSSQPDH